MALETATGQFGITTQAAGNNVSVTGLSFQPKVVLFNWVGRSAVGQAEGHVRPGAGYAVSSTDRGCGTLQDFPAGTMDADAATYDNACIAVIANGGTVNGLADFVSFNSDGFTLVIDDDFLSSYLINYLAIGGSDLTNMASVTVTEPAASGDQDNTSVGFQPDCAIIFSGGTTTINTIQGTGKFLLGVAAGASPVNAILSTLGNPDANPTSNTQGYCKSGECIGWMSTAFDLSFNARGSITAWLSNGFRINWTETANAGRLARVLCLKGGSYTVGNFLTSTTVSSNFSETGVGFQPKAIMIGSGCAAESTADTAVNPAQITVGFAISASARNSMSSIQKSGAASSDNGFSIHTDNFYVNESTAAAIVIEGIMDFVSMDTDGFTMVMDDADPTANFVFYLAFGDTKFGNPPPPKLIQDAVHRSYSW